MLFCAAVVAVSLQAGGGMILGKVPVRRSQCKKRHMPAGNGGSWSVFIFLVLNHRQPHCLSLNYLLGWLGEKLLCA